MYKRQHLLLYEDKHIVEHQIHIIRVLAMSEFIEDDLHQRIYILGIGKDNAGFQAVKNRGQRRISCGQVMQCTQIGRKRMLITVDTHVYTGRCTDELVGNMSVHQDQTSFFDRENLAVNVIETFSVYNVI